MRRPFRRKPTDNAIDVDIALEEADWAMMEEVVLHWRARAGAMLAKLVRKTTRRANRRRPAVPACHSLELSGSSKQ